MILHNIKPGYADVAVGSVKYGHVEFHFPRWYSFDKDGEAVGDGRESRKSAADFILYYYREQAARS